jgi:glycosyltransferase involved in cell wall biosynthesis
MVAKPLTIVQMLPDLISGGVERGTLEIGEFLVKKGHRSIVVSNGGPMVETLVQNGSEHITLPVGYKNPISLLCVPKLRRLFIEEKVDILHLRSRVPAWIGMLAAKTIFQHEHPRILTTFHGFYSVNKYSAIMTKGERVIAISRFIKGHIKEKYGVEGDNISLVFRGFDSSRFNPSRVNEQHMSDLKKQWGLTDRLKPYIILPARFTEWKGHLLFFSALEKLQHLDWTAILVGDENEKPSYVKMLKKEAEAKGIMDRIVFAGHCRDMPAAYQLCDIAVSSSIEPEAFGRVAVEAQAMGLPIIATAHGGSLETVIHNETGWLFSHTDANAFANTLIEAISDEKKRRSIGCRARAWVHEHFTTELMCEKTLNIYKEMVAV